MIVSHSCGSTGIMPYCRTWGLPYYTIVIPRSLFPHSFPAGFPATMFPATMFPASLEWDASHIIPHVRDTLRSRHPLDACFHAFFLLTVTTDPMPRFPFTTPVFIIIATTIQVQRETIAENAVRRSASSSSLSTFKMYCPFAYRTDPLCRIVHSRCSFSSG